MLEIDSTRRPLPPAAPPALPLQAGVPIGTVDFVKEILPRNKDYFTCERPGRGGVSVPGGGGAPLLFPSLFSLERKREAPAACAHHLHTVAQQGGCPLRGGSQSDSRAGKAGPVGFPSCRMKACAAPPLPCRHWLTHHPALH